MLKVKRLSQLMSAVRCRDSRKELLDTISTRRMALTEANIRFAEPKKGEKTHVFEGYAVKWDSINTYGEKFARGAFSDMIEQVNAGNKVIHMYYNHGWRNMFDARSALRIGKYVEFKEDDVGLLVKGELTPGLSLASDVSAMAQHGTVDGLSIAFYPPNDIDVEDMGDHTLIKRADLYEISLVDEPADRNARLSRQTETINNLADERDACDMLKNMGLDETEARHFIEKLDHILDRTGDNKPKPTDDDPFSILDDVILP